MSTNPPLFGAHALDGIRVIDLTRVLGPRNTDWADHGAEVIKVGQLLVMRCAAGGRLCACMASYFINVNATKNQW